jgi:hypothetical protein
MGVKQYCAAEKKGKEVITNEDLKDDGVAHAGEQTEKYGEEKHK